MHPQRVAAYCRVCFNSARFQLDLEEHSLVVLVATKSHETIGRTHAFCLTFSRGVSGNLHKILLTAFAGLRTAFSSPHSQATRGVTCCDSHLVVVAIHCTDTRTVTPWAPDKLLCRHETGSHHCSVFGYLEAFTARFFEDFEAVGCAGKLSRKAFCSIRQRGQLTTVYGLHAGMIKIWGPNSQPTDLSPSIEPIWGPTGNPQRFICNNHVWICLATLFHGFDYVDSISRFLCIEAWAAAKWL